MQPSTNATHRQDLGDILHENALGEGQFVGNMIMPLFNVGVRAGQFARFAFGEVKTRTVDDKRGRLGNYNQIQHETTNDTYVT